MTFAEAMAGVVYGFEAAGVAIFVVGGLIAFAAYVRDLVGGEPVPAYERLRQNLGRCILLGLEVLIIADIILTVTIVQTIEGALILGLIVLVRTFLGFTLATELEGTLPWRRAARRAPD